MVQEDFEDEKEEGFRKRARLLELTPEVRENILKYLGDRFVEETEVYEHLKSKKLEYYLCVMFIQSISSFDMKASLWHPACFTRYKQLYQGIERRYNPDGKGYYLKKRADF